MNIKIDREFRSLIPPIGEEELKGLERSILAEGCRDSLILWNDILLDGHNRYEICRRKKIEFSTRSLTLGSRDQAKIWIICNQLSRRNITPQQRIYLIGMQYKLEKKEVGRPEKQCDQNDHIRTADKMAKQHHVGPATVRRAEKFADAVDRLPTDRRKEVLEEGKKMAESEKPVEWRKRRMPDPNRLKKGSQEERMAEGFKNAFDRLAEEFQNCLLNNWKYTSKKAASDCVEILQSMIED